METYYPYITGKNGALVDLEDSRDILLGAVMPIGAVFPTKYSIFSDFGDSLIVEDQNGSSSCVAQTFSKYSEFLNWKETGVYANLSAKFIYSRIYMPDGGAYMRDGARLTVAGTCLETLDPSYPATEERMRQKNEDPEVLKNARIYKGKAYVSVSNTVEQLKTAIQAGFGCPTGMNITSQGWNGSAVSLHENWVRRPYSGEAYNGHAFLLGGWDDTRVSPYDGTLGAFELLNSWSKSWGFDGRAWVGYNDVAWLFSGWTIIDAPNEVIDTAKNMYNLRRKPNDTNEVYATGNKVRRHIVNYQTLLLGSRDPDKFWNLQEGQEIPVATQSEWDALTESDEILLLPKD